MAVCKVSCWPLPLILSSGKVIGPTFQFDVSEIKFGLVSCGMCYNMFMETMIFTLVVYSGFVNTAEITLCNTSEVPMAYRLRVPSDGTKGAPQDSNNTNNKGSDTATAVPVAVLVKEFAIRPRSGTIPPDLSQDIQVLSLTCNRGYIVSPSLYIRICTCKVFNIKTDDGYCIILSHRWILLQ